jgi:cytochrome c peroxidase
LRVVLLLALAFAACDPDAEREVASSKLGEGMRVRQEPIIALPAAPEAEPALLALGRRLFDDKRLSGDGSVACASCHRIADGGDDGLPFSKGVAGKMGRVNAPTVLNAGNNFALFWDGRAATLEDQVNGPLLDALEMGSTWQGALTVIRGDADYVRAYREVFGAAPDEENTRAAIAAYERALVTPSRFDRWLGGDEAAITKTEREGYERFKGLGCVACHQGKNVGGNMFQRFGVMGDYFKDRGSLTDADLGRFNVTRNEEDKFVFRVPPLRNVAMTAPYFHDGTAKTLTDAIRVMARYQLGREIDDADVELVAAFLSSLTGEHLDKLATLGGTP